jgi:hypothetical protein
LKLFFLLALIGTATGCAHLGSPNDMQSVVDSQKVELIEQWARRNNVSVMWLHYPVRSVPVERTAPANGAPIRVSRGGAP